MLEKEIRQNILIRNMLSCRQFILFSFSGFVAMGLVFGCCFCYLFQVVHLADFACFCGFLLSHVVPSTCGTEFRY